MHVVIIGAYGSAGVAAANELIEGGGQDLDRLTLVDDGEPGGGLCILRGCMPSKEVLSAAGHRFHARCDERLQGELPVLDLERVVARKNEHTASFAEHRRAAVHRLADNEGVEFVHDTAYMVGPRTVAVDGRELRPDYVVIATGSTVNVPDLDGIDDVGFRTSSDVLDATELPDSGLVLGFGYVGIELAPYLAEAGVDLTVIEHDARPLDEAPPAFGETLLDLYREEFGIEVLTETSEERLEPTDDGGVRLHYTRTGGGDPTGSLSADELFLFTGRRPNLDGVGLDNTNLEPGRGWVDASMRAVDDNAGRTYVVGDANGREPVLHVAKEQGQVAARNILRQARGTEPAGLERYDPTAHRVMFAGAAVYPYARVGHTPATAQDAGHEVFEVTRRAADDGVFKTKVASRGLARLVVDATEGTVLGYQGLHLHADVMAKTMQVIVELGLDVREVPDRAYHPTTPEILDGLFRAAGEKLAAEAESD